MRKSCIAVVISGVLMVRLFGLSATLLQLLHSLLKLCCILPFALTASLLIYSDALEILPALELVSKKVRPHLL